jgi:O-antigen/teichoic acid export membrane protein
MITKTVGYLKVIFTKKADLQTEEGRANERMKRIALTAITAMLAKVLQMAIPLITIKVSLAYLGPEIYGLWLTLTSLFSIFAFADLGLGNGLQTQLSQASSRGTDTAECRRLISSCYAILVASTVIILSGFLFVSQFLDWGSIIHAESSAAYKAAGGVAIVVIVTRLSNIPLALVQRTQISLQEGYKSNLWQAVGSVLSLISVYAVSFFDLGALFLIIASSSIPVVISLVNMVFYFRVNRPYLRPRLRYFEMGTAKKLLRTGVGFLIISVLLAISLYLDNFIVARTAQLADVSSFGTVSKVAGLLNVGIAMLSAPLWTANGEALTRGDHAWVKRNTKRIASLTTLILLAGSIPFVLLSKLFFRLWLGESFIFNLNVLIGMLAMQLLIAFINPFFMILNGAGVVKKQIFIFLIFAPICFSLKYLFSSIFGLEAIAWVGTACYGLLVLPPTYVIAMRICDAPATHIGMPIIGE